MTHDTQAARLADEAKRLADEYANCHYKHMRTVALRTDLHAAIDALRDLAIPAGVAVAWPSSLKIEEAGFHWDDEAQQHIPMLMLSFEPVPSGQPNDAKGWADRDATVKMLASPQPTPEASQDGGGALRSAAQAVVDRWDTPLWKDVPATGEFINDLRAALRSPLPGRESTAQAGVATESSSERSSGCLNSSGLAQTLTSETTSPSVLAMREALQGLVKAVEPWVFDGNGIPGIDMRIWDCVSVQTAMTAARAALAALPEPRAGEAEPTKLRVRITQLSEQHGSLRQAALALGINVGYLSRLASGERDSPSDETLAALGMGRNVTYYMLDSPIATPKPQEGR